MVTGRSHPPCMCDTMVYVHTLHGTCTYPSLQMLFLPALQVATNYKSMHKATLIIPTRIHMIDMIYSYHYVVYSMYFYGNNHNTD